MFATHDHPGPGRPVGQVAEIGDFGDIGTDRGVTAGPAGGLPTGVGNGGDPADRGMDAGVGTGDDSEPDVAGPASVHEPAGAPGGIGTDLHPALDK